ncbi:GNAT family N-acetyltransferase [Sutcliffiella sp. NPDC057660]|uniref:GNAT family N-acetyltransferase n=1 Tax=Sutcliffiella sp. NPDC057660 TaxID=3346199 RepID=UPI0036C92714
MTQLKIIKAPLSKREAAAAFIAKMNAKEEQHIGYCGTDRKEILHTLKENLSDIPFTESFIIATHKEEIRGLIGFDADSGNHSAEIWGPFIQDPYTHQLPKLWEHLLALLPSLSYSLSLFSNKKNTLVNRFAEQQGFVLQSEQTILKMDCRTPLNVMNLSDYEITPEFFMDMEKLHDEIFPSTYYSGSQIIERVNAHRKVFIHTEDNKLAGYIFVEVEPEFGEASIEFFAVKDSERRKGIGAMLLQKGVSWIFTFQGIEAINLCVDSANRKAISLYQKVGFYIQHELNYYVKKS